MHEAGQAQPGTMAAVLGLDDEQVDVACRRADADVWVANYNAPGQVVIAGSPAGVEPATGPRQGARRQEGHAAAGVGRLPHAVHDAGPRPAAQGDRRGRPPRHRGARRLQRRRPAPPRGQGVGQPAVGPALVARCAGSSACSSWRTSASPTSSSSDPAACSPAWPSARSTGRTISVATPDDLDKLLEWVGADGATGPGAPRGRAPLRRRAPRRQPGGRRLPARRRTSTTGRTIEVGTVLGHVGDARGPLAVRRRPAELHRRRDRAGHRPSTHRLAAHQLKEGTAMPKIQPGARGAVITGWGTALPPKTLTNDDLAGDGPRHQRRVDRRAHRHP